MDIYTAQYRYVGDDRLDITVKSSVYPGNVLAPTWDMVKRHKDQKLTDWDYATQYFSLLVGRMYAPEMDGRANRLAMDRITEAKQVTFVCFCPPFGFCHRILAARMFENMGYGKYHGEWQI